ncbi:MAG: hypothetical protein HRU36_05515 [Rickettsiales bacterium]|nr:hypothetical protein [Rickettsiales bacterium]
MERNIINYKALLNEAMHNVIRESLNYIRNDTLPGEHFFYISFLTDFRGVEISNTLKEKYPEQMTIVLQHQFEDLVVDEDRFSVTLCFNNKNERLSVPYKAISRFADPSVNIELHFMPIREESEKKNEGENLIKVKTKTPTEKPKKLQQKDNVISLDKFRKK